MSEEQVASQETYGKRATRGFAWNHFYKLSEFGLLNVFTMIIARHFGPVGSTPYVVYAAAGTTLSLLGAFAVDGVLLRFLPRISESGTLTDETTLPGAHDIHSFVRKLFAFRLFVVLCIICLLALCLLLFTNVFAASETFDSLRELVPLLSILLIAQAIVAFSTFSLMGLLRTKAVFICSVITRGAMLATTLVLMFVIQDISIRSVIFIHAASAILNAVLLLANIRHILRPLVSDAHLSLVSSLRAFLYDIYGFFRRPSTVKALLISPVMLYGLTTWGNDLFGILLGRQSDILMIRAIWGDKTPEVGYYNVASLIVLLTEYIFLLGFGGALISVFSKLAHDDELESGSGPKRYPRLLRGGAEIVGFQYVTLVPLCAFVFMFSLPVVQVIYGGQYDPSAPLVAHALVALAINILLFNGGLHITTLMSIGKQRLTLKNRLFWGVVCIVANYFLIQSYGALGAMLGTNWSNTMACATEWYFARKYVGFKMNILSAAKACVISIGTAIGVYKLMELIDLRQGPVVELLVAITIFFSVALGLLYMVKLPEAELVMTRFKKAFA